MEQAPTEVVPNVRTISLSALTLDIARRTGFNVGWKLDSNDNEEWQAWVRKELAKVCGNIEVHFGD